jgi:hypothetical protein
MLAVGLVVAKELRVTVRSPYYGALEMGVYKRTKKMKDLLDYASAASQEENIQPTPPATQDENNIEGVAAQND